MISLVNKKTSKKIKIRRKVIKNNFNVDEINFKVKLIYNELEKLNSDDFKYKIYLSLMKVFGVLKASLVVFEVESILEEINQFKVKTNTTSEDIIYTAIILMEENFKPIIEKISS